MAVQIDNAPILDAIKEYKNFRTDRELCDLLGVKKGILSSWRNNVCRINASTVVAALPEVDINYILTGEGRLLRPGYDPADTPINIEEQPAVSEIPNTDQVALLQRENELLREQNATLKKAIDLLSKMA